MGITSYGSPAPCSVLPSLRLMSDTCKVWSRGVNNIISEIIQWKPAPSTSQVWNPYLRAYGVLKWNKKPYHIQIFSEVTWQEIWIQFCGKLVTSWRHWWQKWKSYSSIALKKNFWKGWQECKDKRRNISFVSYYISSLRFVPKACLDFLYFF